MSSLPVLARTHGTVELLCPNCGTLNSWRVNRHSYRVQCIRCRMQYITGIRLQRIASGVQSRIPADRVIPGTAYMQPAMLDSGQWHSGQPINRYACEHGHDIDAPVPDTTGHVPVQLRQVRPRDLEQTSSMIDLPDLEHDPDPDPFLMIHAPAIVVKVRPT